VLADQSRMAGPRLSRYSHDDDKEFLVRAILRTFNDLLERLRWQVVVQFLTSFEMTIV
jgi:hypothetical protein